MDGWMDGRRIKDGGCWLSGEKMDEFKNGE